MGGREDLKTIVHKEREPNHLLVLYDVKQVQAAEVSQRRTAVSSKCFQLYYTCSDRIFAILLPPCPFHLFSPLTVTFPKLAAILRPPQCCRLTVATANVLRIGSGTLPRAGSWNFSSFTGALVSTRVRWSRNSISRLKAGINANVPTHEAIPGTSCWWL
jgi:hypothetical protein